MSDAHIKTQLIDAFDQLELHINNFNNYWPQFVIDAKVFDIPLYEHAQTPDAICPTLVSGEAAIQRTQTILAQFLRVGEQPATHSVRLPGFIRLDRSVHEHIAEINQAKDLIANLMKENIPAGSRAIVRKQVFGDVSMLQIYRHIFTADITPRRLVFSWIAHTYSTYTKLSIDDVTDMLDAQRSSPPEHYTLVEWAQIIDIEKQKLASPPPHSKIALRKPIAPHPRFMVFHREDHRNPSIRDAQADYNHHANLPFFFVDPLKATRVRMLPDYLYQENYTKRKAKYVYEPIIEKINLYWRRPNTQ